MNHEKPVLNAYNKAQYPPMHNGELSTSPIAIYTNEDNTISLDVKLENDTVWLNRLQMSVLFDRDIKTIGKHLSRKNWKVYQLSQNLPQLRQTEKHTRLSSIM